MAAFVGSLWRILNRMTTNWRKSAIAVVPPSPGRACGPGVNCPTDWRSDRCRC